jgi:hypothetical protein
MRGRRSVRGAHETVESVLLAGLLLGMRHALDPDHLAVVAGLARRPAGSDGLVRHGVVWGLGHALSLIALAVLLLLAGRELPASWSHALSAVVALLLIGLGAASVWRSSVNAPVGAPTGNSAPFPVRTLVLGLAQGLAGSGALLMLAVAAGTGPVATVGYVAVFGLGSLVGMAVIATLVAMPLARGAERVAGLLRWLSIAAGVAMVVIGAVTLARLVQ